MATWSKGDEVHPYKSVKLSLSSSPHSPRLRLAPRLLRDLRIGVGKPALLKISVTDNEAASSSSANKKQVSYWSTGAVWPYKDRVQEKRSASGNRSLTTSTLPKSQDGVLPQCLYPATSIALPHDVDVEVYAPATLPSSKEAEEIRLEIELIHGSKLSTHQSMSASSREILAMVVKELLIDLTCVLPSQRIAVPFHHSTILLSVIPREGEVIDSVEQAASSAIFVGRGTIVKVISAYTASELRGPSASNGARKHGGTSVVPLKKLGGLEEEVKQLKELVFLPLMRPELFKEHGLQPPRGVLLHGPPGTGKTSLALSTAASFLPPSQIFSISGPELSSSYHGRTEARIRKVFREARKNDMSVIIIDEIDVVAGNRDGGDSDGVGSRVVATLLTEIDGVGQVLKPSHKARGKRRGESSGEESNGSGSEDQDGYKAASLNARVVVIAATNRPNAIDPALRRPGRLDREIEIGVPSPSARLAIISALLSDTPHSLTTDDLQQVASRTHGFVGADLSALVREAGMKVIRRRLAIEAAQTGPDGTGVDSLPLQVQHLQLSHSTMHLLTAEDLFTSVPLMRPSSLRSMLPPPPLAWSSIGLGDAQSPYSLAKARILQTVEWPLKHSAQMRRLGISGGRGVLLYGPPGCSKTMIARACADSEGINWIGIKGPELFSKYLGDSEKAVRELFQKARAASPAIIFFDEIDALTATRSSGGDDHGTSAVSDRVIATLLTEMDGADAMDKVVIIAATNRPEVIDSALLRPGRLDTLLYIGPPDRSARLSILELRTKAMATRPGELSLGKIADLTEGCSGAEVVSVCQDAGIRAMSENLEAEAVEQRHFEEAALGMRRRITPEMIGQYERWRDMLVGTK